MKRQTKRQTKRRQRNVKKSKKRMFNYRGGNGYHDSLINTLPDYLQASDFTGIKETVLQCITLNDVSLWNRVLDVLTVPMKNSFPLSKSLKIFTETQQEEHPSTFLTRIHDIASNKVAEELDKHERSLRDAQQTRASMLAQ